MQAHITSNVYQTFVFLKVNRFNPCYLFMLKYFFVVGILFQSTIIESFEDSNITSEGLRILTYALQSWPLNSEGSLTYHAYCNMGHRLIIVIFEDP